MSAVAPIYRPDQVPTLQQRLDQHVDTAVQV